MPVCFDSSYLCYSILSINNCYKYNPKLWQVSTNILVRFVSRLIRILIEMTQLKLRKQFLPRAISDIAAFTFLIFMLPFCYWFEVFVVLPTRHAPGISFWYLLYIVWFTFLLISIVSNLTYIILTDCSIRGEVMPSTLVPPWKFCDLCQCVTPPRSWHCEVCKVCILKRDHHCHFSGCCIGHKNQRFFLMFLIYMTVATVHTTILNACFVIERESFSVWLIIKILFPLAVFTFGMDTSFESCYILIFVINLLGMMACILLLVYHSSLLVKGMVMYEKSHDIHDYDLGSLKKNIIQVFGDRWYLTWISPFIKSHLPSDGIHWDLSQANKPIKYL